jgi:hypothetical protein
MTISKPLLGQKRMNSLFKSFKSSKLGSPTPVSLDLKPARGKLTNHLKNFDDDDNENVSKFKMNKQFEIKVKEFHLIILGLKETSSC